jgi:hypothetical protein
MRRMNIQVRDDVPLTEALAAVTDVVCRGRVSGNGTAFCWHTAFANGLQVSVRLPDKRCPNSDSFVVYKEKTK